MKRTITFSVSAKEEDLVLHAWWCGLIELLNLGNERRPSIGTFVYQPKSGEYLGYLSPSGPRLVR